ncbi:MAG TPA: hypothetical protein DDZ80_24480 [Cyanobacteria bacterium UBA8803]|nr:hypothetical protein [Cyanobacteria bacterium UBA9273]HBL61467.1 hypothetical protein [Cyanobacteria bacterium UBA8803]
MKKILTAATILGTAALSSTFILAPAQAQTATTQTQVEVTFPKVIYLRTFQKIGIDITPADIQMAGAIPGTTGPGTLTASGAGLASADQDTDFSNGLDINSPFGNQGIVPKTIPTAYAVWGIGALGDQVTVTAGITGDGTLENGASTVTMSEPTVSNTGFPAPGLTTPATGNLSLKLNLANVTLAGKHSDPATTVGITAALP